MKIDVYRNLNDDCLSIRSREPEDYGQVVAHKQKISVRDAEFVVQESGQQKCREEGVKNVHAFVRGEWDDTVTVLYGNYITYNPYKHDNFYSPDLDAEVEAADEVIVTTNGVYANDPKVLRCQR